MNREWHLANPMPRNASLQQRIDWHLKHADACGCREIPDSIKQALAERGIPLPPRRTS